MTYVINGLAPEQFADLFSLDDTALAKRRACRVIAGSDRGWPCRVSLADARAGEELILVHHVSHDRETPYRHAYAIYVRAGVIAARYHDAVPPVLTGRPIALRTFDRDGMLRAAQLALHDDADMLVRTLFADPDVAYIDAHNAAHGCFAARIERDSACPA